MLENTSTITQRMEPILIALGIHPGEGVAVGLLFAQSFLLGLSFFALYTAGTAIFLSYFDASAMAYVYVIAACLLILIGVFFNRLEQRIPLSQLLLGSMGGLLLTLLLLRIGLWATSSSLWASWVAFLLIVALRICWTLINLVIWALAGRLFNVRQSKRLFPLIIVGTVLAIIVSGLLNQPLIDLMGIPNLLWISVSGMAGAMGLLFITLRIFQENVGSSHVTNQSLHATTNPGIQKYSLIHSWLKQLAPFRDRYILWMITFTALSTLATYLLEFIFIREANAYYQDTAAYASFFGTYLSVATLILLVTSLFSSTLFERLGLRIGLQSNAGAVTLFAILFLISSFFLGTWSMLFWLVVLTKLSDDVLVVAMTNTAARILYQPLPASQRVSIQTVMESIVLPAAIGFVGLFLIALQFLGELTTRQLFLVLIILSLGWTFASFKIYAAYQEALRKALLKRRFADVEADQTTSEREQVLREGLRSEHPGVVLYSLNMLVDDEASEENSITSLSVNNSFSTSREVLPELLYHEAMEVRLDVAQRMEDTEWLEQIGKPVASSSWLTLVQARLDIETSIQVRAALGRALIALAEASGDQEVLANASENLFDPSSDLYNATLVGLLRHGGIQGVLTAGPRLLELTHSATKEDRILAAQVVGQVKESKFYQPLLTLLVDEDSEVRNAAIHASGQVNNAALWPLVAQGLGHISTRKGAVRILGQGGNSVLPIVSALFTDPDQNHDVQIALARIIGQIGGPKAEALLWAQSTQLEGKWMNQGELWRSLRRNGFKSNAEQTEFIYTQIKEELERASWLSSAWEVIHQKAVEAANREATKPGKITIEGSSKVINEANANMLLADALVGELGLVRSRLFELLSFICDQQLILEVRRILEQQKFALSDAVANPPQHQFGDEEQRAYALEVLDDLLPSTVKQWTLPLLSGELNRRTREAMRESYSTPILTYTEWLLKLIDMPHAEVISWTKACAIYAANSFLSIKHAMPITSPQDNSTTLKGTMIPYMPQPKEFSLLDAVKMQQKSQDPLIRETASWFGKYSSA
ncbi:MAG: HEAT repeat domain-containing protein [Chloroflexota bacterium]